MNTFKSNNRQCTDSNGQVAPAVTTSCELCPRQSRDVSACHAPLMHTSPAYEVRSPMPRVNRLPIYTPVAEINTSSQDSTDVTPRESPNTTGICHVHSVPQLKLSQIGLESQTIFQKIPQVHSSEDEESIQENSGHNSQSMLLFSQDSEDLEVGDRRTRLLSGYRSDYQSCYMFSNDNERQRGFGARSSASQVTNVDLKAQLKEHFNNYKSGGSSLARPTVQAKVSGRNVPQHGDNPTKGVVYYVIHTILMSINLYVNKAAFDLNPLVGVFQFTFLRGIIATLLMLVCNYGHLRADLIDSVDRKQLPSLIFRCAQGGISVLISFMCIKFFNVSTVGVVCSLTPIFVCIIAYLLLGERLKLFDQAALVTTFAAVMLVIFGAQGEDGKTMQSNAFAFIALLSQPVLLAAGAVAMRQMRKLPETTCSTYQNISLTLLSAVFMLWNGLSFSFMFEFTWQAWLLAIAGSLLTIWTQLAKFSAFKYQEASALQKLAFVPNVWQFFADLIIFGLTFTGMQYAGFGLLFGFYSLEVLRFVHSKRAQKKAQMLAQLSNDDNFAKV